MNSLALEHNRNPKVSVIIPCYNCASSIQTAIDSVLSQDYGPMEVIVVDDGSTDMSAQAASTRNIVLIRQLHRGAAAARNVGVEASTGDYIAFLDADDIRTEGSLSRRMTLFTESNDIGLVFGNLELVDAETRVSAGFHFDARSELTEMDRICIGEGEYIVESDPVPFLLKRPFISTITAVMPRRVWAEVGGFDESLAIAEDVDLWLRVAARYPIAYTTFPVAVYMRGTQSVTSNQKRVIFGLVIAWSKFLRTYSKDYPQLGRLFAENLCSYAYQAGLIKLAERDLVAARRYFATGIRCIPRFRSAWVKYLSTFLHV